MKKITKNISICCSIFDLPFSRSISLSLFCIAMMYAYILIPFATMKRAKSFTIVYFTVSKYMNA